MKRATRHPLLRIFILLALLPAVALPLVAAFFAAIGAETPAALLGFAYIWPAYRLVELLGTENSIRDYLFIDYGIGITIPLGVIVCSLIWMLFGTILAGGVVLWQRIMMRFVTPCARMNPQDY